MTADLVLADGSARVEPGDGADRRHVRGRVGILALEEFVAPAKRSEFLGIPLLHFAETAKLALDTIIVAVVVGVTCDEAAAADPVVRLDSLDHMHWERKPRDPRLAVLFILQIEPGGRCIFHSRFSSQIVFRCLEEMGLPLFHEIDVEHPFPAFSGKRR